MRDILLVSFGSILGANVRFIIYKKFERYISIKNFRVLIINTSACFLLGFFLSFIQRINTLNYSYPFALFFLVGFLGSLSTFSTFMYEIFEVSLKLKIFPTLKLFFISYILGIISLAFGILLGN